MYKECLDPGGLILFADSMGYEARILEIETHLLGMQKSAGFWRYLWKGHGSFPQMAHSGLDLWRKGLTEESVPGSIPGPPPPRLDRGLTVAPDEEIRST
jgi:hypothetical protein